jgi:carboxylesterase type B
MLIIFFLNMLINLAKTDSVCEIYNENILILTTLNGKIIGSCENIAINYANKPMSTINPVLKFLSVPYANPPINELRFKNPTPIIPWNDIRDGTCLPSKCLQTTELDENNDNYSEQSEDCLYLNIYSPYNAYVKSVVQNDTSSYIPIMVWIHSGDFSTGSANTDGSKLALISNIIVITIQYRLGVFGFLHIKGTDAIGNQALYDQSLALKWIYHNAHTFGGDRTKITIVGENSGAISVGFHLVFRPSWNYYRNAILESAGFSPNDLNDLLLTSDEATQKAKHIGLILGCNETNQDLLVCLQSADKNQMNLMSSTYLSYPAFVFDSNVFKETSKHLFQKEDFKKCNILTGSNTYEDIKFELGDDLLNRLVKGSKSALRESLKKSLNNINDFKIDNIINLYANTTSLYLNFLDILTDFKYRCPTNQLAEVYSENNQKAFVYLYEHKLLTVPLSIGFVDRKSFGEPLDESSIYSNEEKLLYEKMYKYWANFIANDRPTNNDEWPSFSQSNSINEKNVLYLKGLNITNVTYFNDEKKCQFWKSANLKNKSFTNNTVHLKATILVFIYCVFILIVSFILNTF